MTGETTAQMLARTFADQLSAMTRFGARFNYSMLSGTRVEIQFPDGEIILVSFSKPKSVERYTPL